MRFYTCFLASLALGAAPTMAASIGVSFAGDNGGGTSIQIAPTQTAGVVPQMNWNDGTGATGSLTDLVDDSGAATTADVDWASANTWGGSGATTDDEAMVNGWLDDGQSGAQVTVSDIPYAFYDVYVYGSSDSGNETRGWNTEINGTVVNGDGTFATLQSNGSFFDGTNYVNESSGAGEPTYAVLRGQSGDLRILGIRQSLNGIDSRGAVSGFQIVESEIPEPTSFVLLGGMGLAVGFAAWRRR